jgi:cell division protein FtsW (lipid II flippase)
LCGELGLVHADDPFQQAPVTAWGISVCTAARATATGSRTLTWNSWWLRHAFTVGIFLVVWMLVQPFRVRKINPKSKATVFYTLAALAYVALFVIGNLEQNVRTPSQMVLQTVLWWAGAILYVIGSFRHQENSRVVL